MTPRELTEAELARSAYVVRIVRERLLATLQEMLDGGWDQAEVAEALEQWKANPETQAEWLRTAATSIDQFWSQFDDEAST